MSRLLLLVLCLATSAARAAETQKISREAREFFEKSVRPILVNNCYKCHGPNKQKGDLRLDSRAAMLAGGQTGPAITPGKPEDSELILAISYDPSGYQMPPTGKLDEDKIAALTKWIKRGIPGRAIRKTLQSQVKNQASISPSTQNIGPFNRSRARESPNTRSRLGEKSDR